MGNVQRFGQGANSSEGLQEVFNVSCFLDCRKMGGMDPPADFLGTLPGFSNYTLGGETDVTVTVKSALTDTQILNAFGVVKGFVDPGEYSEHTPERVGVQSELGLFISADRYVVLGAQRDAFGEGFAKSTVGTSLLVELARAITNMVKGEENQDQTSSTCLP